MYSEIENKVKKCRGFQETRPKPPASLIHSCGVPKGPWNRLNIDLSVSFKGYYHLFIIDAFSKWAEIFIFKSMEAEVDVDKLDEVISRFGGPIHKVTDNGTQFTETKFSTYCKKLGIKHLRTTPYHSRSNSMVERIIRTFKSRYREMDHNKRAKKKFN